MTKYAKIQSKGNERGKMMKNDSILIEKMTEFYSGDPGRIQHFIKVYTFATLIGEGEKLSSEQMFILRTAAIIHDIGIKPAEAKYGSSAGELQEKEGPAEAEKMLRALGYEDSVIERVCWLVGHHHTYSSVKEIDHRILVEADFIVNAYESNMKKESIIFGSYKIFRTATGKRLLETIFAL